MGDTSYSVTYFAEPGPQNTETTLQRAFERGRELGLDTVVVASDSGKTARETLRVFHPGFRVVVVTNPDGVAIPVARLHSYLPRFQEHQQRLAHQGIRAVPASLSKDAARTLVDAGAQVTRIDWKRVGAFARDNMAAIDRIGVGTRVALTVSVWAHLAGFVPADQSVVALAGTGFGGGGADTALVVLTAARWADWRVLETIARPRHSPPSELAR